MPKIQLKQFNHNIFLVSFDNAYDLGMHFLRWSEYRESPVFRGQAFKIMDFIDDYSRKNNGVFTYCQDWGGFNVPSSTFDELSFNKILDFNKYDVFMQGLISFIRTIAPYKFYLVGHITGRSNVVEHELSHAMFDMIPGYRKAMEDLIDGLTDTYPIIEESLVKMGYHPSVCRDECHAYLSTGMPLTIAKALRKNKIPIKIATSFKKLFKKYRKDL